MRRLHWLMTLMTVVVLMTTAVGTFAEDRWVNYTAGNSSVWSIARDGERYVWCGGRGIAARFDTHTGQRVVYTRADGLANDWVASIAVDNAGQSPSDKSS